MYIKNFYCCSICDNPYSSEEQAFVCSNEPCDSRYDNITTGETILFTEESYDTAINKVIKKYQVEGVVLGKLISPGTGVHNVSIAVLVQDYIRMVVFNNNRLLSFPTQKFPKSFIENLNLK